MPCIPSGQCPIPSPFPSARIARRRYTVPLDGPSPIRSTPAHAVLCADVLPNSSPRHGVLRLASGLRHSLGCLLSAFLRPGANRAVDEGCRPPSSHPCSMLDTPFSPNFLLQLMLYCVLSRFLVEGTGSWCRNTISPWPLALLCGCASPGAHPDSVADVGKQPSFSTPPPCLHALPCTTVTGVGSYRLRVCYFTGAEWEAVAIPSLWSLDRRPMATWTGFLICGLSSAFVRRFPLPQF